MGRPRLSDRAPLDLEILTDIALRLFNDRGYEATTMADIGAAAGINKASIYFHAPGGKEELLERGVNRALDHLFAVLDEPGMKRGSAVDRLRYLVERGIEVEVKYLPEVTVLVRLRGNTEVERRALERRRKFDAHMARLVKKAQLEGGIRRDLDPTLLTRLLLGMEVSLTEWYRSDGRLGWREVADAILALAFEGITESPH